MDNLGAHRATGICAAIEAAGATVLYLPPYHPDLNPIEYAWSKWKGLLRKRAARTYRELAVVLSETRDLITESDLRGWYQHVGALHQVV